MWSLVKSAATESAAEALRFNFNLVTVCQGPYNCMGVAVQAAGDPSDKWLKVAFVPSGSVQMTVFNEATKRAPCLQMGELNVVDLTTPQKNISVMNPKMVLEDVAAEPMVFDKLFQEAFLATQERAVEYGGATGPELSASVIGRVASLIAGFFVNELTKRVLSSSDLIRDSSSEDETPGLSMIVDLPIQPYCGSFSHLKIEWGKDSFIWGDFGHHAFFLVTEFFHGNVEILTRHEVRRPKDEVLTCGYTLAGRTVFDDEKEIVEVVSNLKTIRADEIDLLAKDIMRRYSYNVAFANCQHFLFKLFNKMITHLKAKYDVDGDPRRLEDIALLVKSVINWQSKFSSLGQLMISVGDSGGEEIQVPLQIWLKQLPSFPDLTALLPSLEMPTLTQVTGSFPTLDSVTSSLPNFQNVSVSLRPEICLLTDTLPSIINAFDRMFFVPFFADLDQFPKNTLTIPGAWPTSRDASTDSVASAEKRVNTPATPAASPSEAKSNHETSTNNVASPDKPLDPPGSPAAFPSEIKSNDAKAVVSFTSCRRHNRRPKDGDRADRWARKVR